MELKNKFILDACCGPRYMWYNKQHPNTLYIDIRQEPKGFIKEAPEVSISPDVVMDYRKLEFLDNQFRLIVWDIPHFKARRLTGVMLKKFGCLHPETWPDDINKGFKEIWRVLQDYGVLIMKFSDYHIKFDQILANIPEKPLFFNKINSKGVSETRWFCFMKIPKDVGEFQSKDTFNTHYAGNPQISQNQAKLDFA